MGSSNEVSGNDLEVLPLPPHLVAVVLEVVVSHSLVSRDGIIGMMCEYHQNALGQFFKTSSSGIEIKSLAGMIVGRSSVRFDDKIVELAHS